MEEFNIIGFYKFNDNKYLTLQNIKNRYIYWIKLINNNQFQYIELKEYIKLYKEWYSFRCFFNNDEKNNNPVIHRLSKRKLSIIPKIIYKGVPLVLSLSILFSISTMCNEELFTEDDDIIFGTTSQRYSSTIEVAKENKKIYAQTIKEFGKLIGIENITFDDLRKVVNDNENLSNEYKITILKGIDNIQKYLPNMDLEVLYYNLKRIKIIIITQDEMNNIFNNGNNYQGGFSWQTGEVYIIEDEKSNESVLFHEIFGHGSTIAEMHDEKTEDTYYYFLHIFQPDKINTIINKNRKSISPPYGNAWNEACPAILGNIACGITDYRLSNCYLIYVQELGLILDLYGIDITDIVNNGFEFIVDYLNKKNIDGLKIIQNADICKIMDDNGSTHIDKQYLISENIRAILINYYNYLVKNGSSSEEAIKQIQEIMEKNSMGPIDTGYLGIYGPLDFTNLNWSGSDYKINDYLFGECCVDITFIPEIILPPEENLSDYSRE